jgi:hypothetical protein
MEANKLQKIAKHLANAVHCALAWDEPMDGDSTEYLAKEFLLELDELNGNK